MTCWLTAYSLYLFGFALPLSHATTRLIMFLAGQAPPAPSGRSSDQVPAQAYWLGLDPFVAAQPHRLPGRPGAAWRPWPQRTRPVRLPERGADLRSPARR